MLGLQRAERRELGCFLWDASASEASYVLQLPQCHWPKEGEVEDGRRTGGSGESDVHSLGVCVRVL